VLLEDHLKQLRAEDGIEDDEVDEDDETGWDDWDVQSDSSEESSDGWIDIESDGEDLDVSDSDDEEKPKEKELQQASNEPARVSTLATSKILTPADFALLSNLRIQAATEAVQKGGGSATKRKLATLEANKKILGQSANAEDTFISENDILGPRKKAKADYAERMASIEKGREGREKFGSLKGKKNKAAPSSSTNKEKARNKPIMMVLASGAVRSKKKASLREKQRKLRAHIERAKKSHH